METYLEKLLSQIRCKKARPYIAEEIRDHIECQIADNLSEGMTSEEAEKNAVTDMGDPVEVGISLDRIHKPKIAWRLLVIVGIWLSRCYWIPPHVCDLLPRLYRNCKVLQVHRRSYSDSGRAAGGRLRWSGCQRNRQLDRIWKAPGGGYFPDDVLCADLRRYPI